MNQQLPKKNEHFAAWYDAIIKRAKLAQPSPIKGMFMFLPRAWAIWEQIENFLNQQFQKHSIWNVKFPTILPRSDFEVEKEHIAGFDPELFYVQNHGSTEQLVLRPTSETAFCHYFKSQLHSYQDLPIKINQWCSVFRIEKNTKAFLRTCEFYWQELHTIHVNKQEAYDMVQQEIIIYKKCLKELLNLSFLSGWKSVYERFGGAEDTYTLETLMPDGQMLQSCTAHYLGQNFSKPFGLEFTNQKNQKELVYQTSAGLSTRILGAMIMAHSDNYGLVLPFAVAPIQIAILDITKKSGSPKTQLINQIISCCSAYRYMVESRKKGLGYLIQEHELGGTPLVIIIGDQEVTQDQILIFIRTTREKIKLNSQQLKTQLPIMIANYGQYLLENNQKWLNNNVIKCTNWQEVLQVIQQKQVAYAPWFNDQKNELTLKEQKVNFGIRCLAPLVGDQQTKCVFSQQPANCCAYFARSY